MTITATTSHDTGKRSLYDTFTFDDGVTVTVKAGLVCSTHGRRHCKHHCAAHAAIISRAASDEAALLLDEEYDAFSAAVTASAPDPLPADLGEPDPDDDPEPPPAAPQSRRKLFPASHVYLLHFSSPVAHARHYLGSSNDLERRLAEHRNPNDPNGARLPHVAVIRGADLIVARTWRGGRRKERNIKEAYKHSFTTLCPLCSAGAGSRPKTASVTKYSA